MLDLSKYSVEQRVAIESIGNVCLIASAGGGKTTVLIERTAYLITERKVKPSSILLMTFSKKAAKVMKDRLEKKIGKNDVNVGTFHSVFYEILRDEDLFFRNAKIMRSYEKENIIHNCVVNTLGLETSNDDVKVAEILKFIDMQRQYCKYYDDVDFVECGEMIYSNDIMAKIYKDYEENKRKSNMMDFSDMIYMAYRLFKSKPKILKKYQKKFNYFLIDEVMDSPLQQIELIQMLNEGNEQTFIVGDFLQSLYSFVGGSPEYMLNFDKLFNNAKILHLTTNYRSSSNIVDFSNRLFTGSEDASHAFYKHAIANNGIHKEPEYTIYPNTIEESYEVGQRIKDMVSSDKTLTWKNFAIIYRVNSQSCAIEQSFAELDIPYEVCADSKSFFELREVRDMLSFLKLGYNKDNNAMKQIYFAPLRGLGKVFLQDITKVADNMNCTLYDAMEHLPQNLAWRYKKGMAELCDIYEMVSKKIGKTNIGDIIRTIRKVTKYDKFISKNLDGNDSGDDKCSKIDNLDSLCDQASRYVDVEKFFADISKIIARKEEQVQSREQNKDVVIDAVTVSTTHKLKGSEFKHVFGISINDSMFPHYKATNIPEELRNLYVLVSRAESGLYLSSTLMNGKRSCRPSKFLEKVYSKEYIAKQIKICGMKYGDVKVGKK